MVSVPASGSVTPKACSRSSPDAIFGQIGLLLRRRAVPQHHAHGVHLRVAGAAVAAGAVDFLQHRRAAPQPQARAAVFLRDQHRQEPGLGQGGDKLGRILPLAIQRPPIGAGNRAHSLRTASRISGKVVSHGASLAPASPSVIPE